MQILFGAKKEKDAEWVRRKRVEHKLEMKNLKVENEFHLSWERFLETWLIIAFPDLQLFYSFESLTWCNREKGREREAELTVREKDEEE